jgi:hypothetical protein
LGIFWGFVAGKLVEIILEVFKLCDFLINTSIFGSWEVKYAECENYLRRMERSSS